MVGDDHIVGELVGNFMARSKAQGPAGSETNVSEVRVLFGPE